MMRRELLVHYGQDSCCYRHLTGPIAVNSLTAYCWPLHYTRGFVIYDTTVLTLLLTIYEYHKVYQELVDLLEQDSCCYPHPAGTTAADSLTARCTHSHWPSKKFSGVS
jgi:hypothetical protein